MTAGIPEAGGHTPGPWRVARNKARRVTNENGVVICNAVLRNSGTAKGGIKHGAKAEVEAEANARLIAAAPDLLEALKRLLAMVADGYPEMEDTVPVQKARAAIAKATQP